MIKSSFPNRHDVERGILMDVSIAAQVVGFTCPVALTRAVWKDCLTWCANSDMHQKKSTSDQHLNDILELAFTALRSSRWKDDHITFSVFQPPSGYKAYNDSFKMIRSTYNGESVITIMQADVSQ